MTFHYYIRSKDFNKGYLDYYLKYQGKVNTFRNLGKYHGNVTLYLELFT